MIVIMLVTPNEVSHHRTSPDAVECHRLVETHVDLASFLARRFMGRGEEFDDLRQVAMLALVKASHRFDPSYGYTFSTFATPTVIGALKRHLRDHTWAIRPPRSLQERYLEVNAAVDTLTGELRRVPETAELAAYGAWSEQEVRDALAERAHRNLEHWDSASESGHPETGIVDRNFEQIEDRCFVEKLLDEIGARDRAIVEMRFFEGLGQAAIGRHVGVSQMHVSRLLKASLEALRVAAAQKQLAS